MNKEYVATFVIGRQISEYEFDVKHPALKVTEKTTVKEIVDWYNSYFNYPEFEVILRELESVKSEIIEIDKKRYERVI